MQEHDWFYRVYDRNADADVFGVFAPIVRLWLSKFDGDVLPDWTDFEFRDFAGWYGNISLGEIKPDYSEMIFLLWGTGLVDLWGTDYTGKSMEGETIPAHWDTVEKPYVKAIVERKAIGIAGGRLAAIGREFINITYVDLPVRRSGKEPYLMSVYQRDMDRTSLDDAEPFYSHNDEQNPRL
ncbi:MAG: hypothetical protein RIM72_13775 [Alphaproteobacteria bacterium]